VADGSTASGPGEYPSLSYNLVTVPGVDNPLSAPIYMVRLDTEHAVLAGPTDVALELPGYPGFKLEIAKDGVTFPDGSRTGLVSVTSVNSSAVPMVPPNGMQPQFIVSIQPTNARFDPPAALTIPNLDAYPPGTQTEMYSFDHDLEEFVPIGLGTVSEDGSVIRSNAGVGVVKAGWHATTRPEEKGCTCNCGICTSCGNKCGCSPVDGHPGALASQDVRGDCRAPECRSGFVITGKDDGDVPEPVPGDCHKVTCYSGSKISTIDTSDAPSDDKCKRCGADGSVVPVEVSGGETSVQYTFKPPVPVINRLNQGLSFFERFGAEVKLTEPQVTGSLKTKKCCEKTTGEGTETEGKVSGDFGSFTLDWQAWPPVGAGSFDYDFEKEAGGATLNVEAEFKGGVFFGLSAKVSGEVGFRSSGCTGNPDGCVFAKVGTTVTLNPRIGIEGTAKLAYSCLFCTGLAIDLSANITAAQASWPFAVSDISYNAEQCDGEISGGVFQPGTLELSGKATFSGSWSPNGGAQTYAVQEEFTLFNCTYGATGLDCPPNI
jgi:hypothetical protein